MNEPLLSRRDAVLKTVAGIGVATVLVRSVAAQAQSADDQTILKALIRAERNAIETYKAGAGVISAATVADPLFHYQGVVLAIAKHFLAQHTDHEAKLVKYLTAQGGTDDVGAGSAQIPTGFVASIKNVVDLATNAEKGAAIAYTDVQKSISRADNAELAAAIGSDETQHFVVLQLVANGFVVPAAATKDKTDTELAPAAAKFGPRSFTVTIDGAPGLDDPGLAFYDVTQ
ncbi:MAG: ferritin-like domain-containing protein [Myxococcaceae bacterium]|nr:ferritin-like domain-containing protein [Myxococcaceae bacterium]